MATAAVNGVVDGGGGYAGGDAATAGAAMGLAAFARKTNASVKPSAGVDDDTAGVARALNGLSPGLNALLNALDGFARFQTLVVTKMAWVSNDTDGLAFFLAPRRRSLTPFVRRSSGFVNDTTGVRRDAEAMTICSRDAAARVKAIVKGLGAVALHVNRP
ncbi:MAG TPA: hypothetical protein VMB50_03695 [Myxococcales bacterium]|nr:hypothetical protein [Myxococcales bacterium]